MLRKMAIVIALTGLISGASSAFGASKASLFLVGEVEVINELYVTPVLGDLDALNIVDGESSRNIASVEEKSNNTTGYTITMESTNTGKLEHNNGTSDVAYTIKYGIASAIAPGAPGAAVLVKTVATLTALTTATTPVLITVAAGGGLLPAGAYTDTLTFTMTAQ